MTQHDYALKWLFYSLTALLIVVLQSLVFNHLSLWGVHPFLFPLIAALVTMWEGNQGLVFSMVFGLLVDLTAPGPVPCFYTLSFFVVAAATIFVVKRLIVRGFICAFASSLLSIVLCDLLQMLFLSYSAGIAFFPALLLTAKELLLSVVCMPLLYFPFRWLHSRAQTE